MFLNQAWVSHQESVHLIKAVYGIGWCQVSFCLPQRDQYQIPKRATSRVELRVKLESRVWKTSLKKILRFKHENKGGLTASALVTAGSHIWVNTQKIYQWT